MYDANKQFSRDDYAHQPYYCEENIWHLCQHKHFPDSHVIVISSLGEYFPMLRQINEQQAELPVLWDYHVILLIRENKGDCYILDFNTSLPFCTPLKVYFEQSFMAEALLKPTEVPLFRILTAQQYIAELRSDRSHMKAENNWLSPPPAWNPISKRETNLKQFTDMTDQAYGEIMTAQELLLRFIA